MTETLPRPRDSRAEADDTSESDPLLLCAPLRIEARAIRRGLRDDPGPPAVTRTGWGTARATQEAERLSHASFAQLMIMGVGAGLSSDLSPGDLVLTGSPAGNGAHWGVFLADGDVLEGEITGLGRQRNHVTTSTSTSTSTSTGTP